MDLGKQVGPLPLGAWFAVVGAGLGFALYTRNASSGGSTTTRDTTTDPGTGAGAGIDPGTGDGSVGGWTPTYPTTTGAGVQTITDNDSWGVAAINYLIATGYDPATSQSAIGHALQGTAMSIREYALWGVALAHLGAPPYAVDVVPPVSTPGPVNPTNPAPHPASTPARGRWYTITPGMTLHKVSRKFYGTPSRWDDIFRVNKNGVARPQGIAPHPHPAPGWLTNRNPDAHLPVGRNLFIPR